MSAPDAWKKSLASFFSDRARELGPSPELADHCFVSGRDPRVWADRRDYDDLIDSIVDQLGLVPQSRILEVGCASGFIALGLAPRVAHYTGVDLAKPALAVARSMQLPNAEFLEADGSRLPFPDGAFDAVLCYDVFTNLPTPDIGDSIIGEMVRVLRPGGKALVGSIPDQEHVQEFETKAAEVQMALREKYGDVPVREVRESAWRDLARRILRQPAPSIICYYFHRDQFIECARRLAVRLDLLDVHPRNPYRGLRFNARFVKSAT